MHRAIRVLSAFVLSGLLWFLLSGVVLAYASPGAASMTFLENHQKVLQETLPSIRGTLTPGSPEEQAAIDRLKALFADLGAENVKANLQKVYAPDTYFNDTLVEIRGAKALEEHMVKTSQAVHSCKVDFIDVVSKDGEYYLRWHMHILFKSLKKGEVQSSIGMTHMRFNPAGLVTYHQDYWDSTTHFFEKLPVLGGLLRLIKGAM